MNTVIYGYTNVYRYSPACSYRPFSEMRSNGELLKEQFIEHRQSINIRIAQLDEILPELQTEVNSLARQMASTDVVLDEANQPSNRWAEKIAIIETIRRYRNQR